ncbi:MAG: hypothetical protein AB8G16_18450 [Gammaproteobacteria bacterium]
MIGLNHNGPCSDLVINTTIEFCEYFGDAGREKRRCPAINVEGAEAFAGINIIRED